MTTLEEYRQSKHEDFFLAIIVREISWEEATDVVIYLPEYPNGVTVAKALELSVKEALAESDEPVTEENINRVKEDVKKTISTQLESWAPVILLKHEEGYIDLSEMKELGEEYEIKCIIPLADYYEETEYSFEENEDGIYLDIDNDPFISFVEDYVNGMYD